MKFTLCVSALALVACSSAWSQHQAMAAGLFTSSFYQASSKYILPPVEEDMMNERRVKNRRTPGSNQGSGVGVTANL
jgi:hypothetical protein